MENKELLGHLRAFSMSRRHFLRATAIASGLAAAATLSPTEIAGVALAESAAATGGDLGILNYALTLEHFENVLYRTLLKTGLLKGKALTYARAFGAHENAHVVTLTSVIKKLGGTPVKEQRRYNLPAVKTQAEVINILATVEDVGASAYLGAAPLIQDGDLLQAAVTIHTVEAEHAAAFRYLNGQRPAPAAFAQGRTKEEILKIVTPFLTVM